MQLRTLFLPRLPVKQSDLPALAESRLDRSDFFVASVVEGPAENSDKVDDEARDKEALGGVGVRTASKNHCGPRSIFNSSTRA